MVRMKIFYLGLPEIHLLRKSCLELNTYFIWERFMDYAPDQCQRIPIIVQYSPVMNVDLDSTTADF